VRILRQHGARNQSTQPTSVNIVTQHLRAACSRFSPKNAFGVLLVLTAAMASLAGCVDENAISGPRIGKEYVNGSWRVRIPGREPPESPDQLRARGECDSVYQRNKLYAVMAWTYYDRECLFDKGYDRDVPIEYRGVADDPMFVGTHDCRQWNIKFHPEKYASDETCSEWNREDMADARKQYAKLKAEGKTP
jgi:hypothetical protein